MKKTLRILLYVVTICLGPFVILYFGRVVEPRLGTVEVVQAARDIERGKLLEAADLKLARVGADQVVSGAYAETATLVGQEAAVSVRRKEQLRPDMLILDALTPGRDQVNMPLPAEWILSAPGSLLRGDKIALVPVRQLRHGIADAGAPEAEAANAGANADTDADADTDANANADTDANAHTDAGADADTNTDTGTSAGSGAGTGARSGTDARSGTGAGSDTDTGTATGESGDIPEAAADLTDIPVSYSKSSNNQEVTSDKERKNPTGQVNRIEMIVTEEQKRQIIELGRNGYQFIVTYK